MMNESEIEHWRVAFGSVREEGVVDGRFRSKAPRSGTHN